MSTCPHCKKESISWALILKHPFSSVLECPVCHTQIRYKRKLSNYAMPSYILSTLIASRFFHANIGLDTYFGTVLALTAAAMQITLVAFEEVNKGAGGNYQV